MSEKLASHASSEHCLLLIPAPTDEAVYSCFRRIAQRWRTHFASESLRIEGDVPLTAGLTQPNPPPTIGKLVHANIDVIAAIDLQLTGVRIRYLRSGGHGPTLYRLSFFDEISIEVEDTSAFDYEQLGQLLRELWSPLDVSGATGTGELLRLTELLPRKAPNASEHRA